MTTKIKLITFDAFGTLFRPLNGKIGHIYVTNRYFTSFGYLMFFLNKTSILIQAKEAAKFEIKVEESLIDKKFRDSFRNVYKLYRNYGYNSGLSSKDWWSKV